MKASLPVNDPNAMPWENFRLMTNDDLKSIYRYLQTLVPVDRDVGPTFRQAGWKSLPQRDHSAALSRENPAHRRFVPREVSSWRDEQRAWRHALDGLSAAGYLHGRVLRGYRQWLPTSSWEANAQLGGSYVASHIEDYYVTPANLGYDRIVKFDHDFIGREALEAKASQPQCARMTLVWRKEDVVRVYESQFGSGSRIPLKNKELMYATSRH